MVFFLLCGSFRSVALHPKRPRSRAARGSSLQRAPLTPPAKSGLMRAMSEAPGGATDLKCGWLAKKRWSGRPGVSARKQGSADREDRADGRFASRMNSESAALGSLAMRLTSHGECRFRGRCGELPARMGSGRFQLTRGESPFPDEASASFSKLRNDTIELLVTNANYLYADTTFRGILHYPNETCFLR